MNSPGERTSITGNVCASFMNSCMLRGVFRKENISREFIYFYLPFDLSKRIHFSGMKKIFSDSFSRAQIIAVVFFAIVYSLISLVNHYNFRTYAYDLGLMNNAMYDYAHFRFNNCTIIQPELKNYLSEHFELFILLLSPFSYLFGTYTLLIFQIVAILFGGFGVYRYIYEI